MSHTNLSEATGTVHTPPPNYNGTHDEEDLELEPEPSDPVSQLVINLQNVLDTLYIVCAEAQATSANLTAVQKRCSELMEENRRLREVMGKAGVTCT